MALTVKMTVGAVSSRELDPTADYGTTGLATRQRRRTSSGDTLQTSVELHAEGGEGYDRPGSLYLRFNGDLPMSFEVGQAFDVVLTPVE
jgi:hypothetical protein